MKKRTLPVVPVPRELIWGSRYLMFQLFFLGTMISWFLALLGKEKDESLWSFVFYAINLAAVVWIFRSYLWQSVKYGISRRFELFFAAVLGLGIHLILTTCLNELILHIQPTHSNSNDDAIHENLQNNFFLTALGAVLLVPLAEETLCRGMIFGSLHGKKPRLAYLFSALFFAFMHVISFIGVKPWLHVLLSILQYLPAGFVLAWSYAYSGSILAPVIIHTASNAIAVYTMR